MVKVDSQSITINGPEIHDTITPIPFVEYAVFDARDVPLWLFGVLVVKTWTVLIDRELGLDAFRECRLFWRPKCANSLPAIVESFAFE